jgi:hypothetical protein
LIKLMFWNRVMIVMFGNGVMTLMFGK